MKKTLIIGSALLIFVFGVLILRPVPIVAEEDAIIEQGIVSKIYESGVNDITFRLEGNNRRFYINRGLELGLNIEDLRTKLIGEQVIFKYPEYWTPLDWNHTIKHLSKVESQKEVIFNEL